MLKLRFPLIMIGFVLISSSKVALSAEPQVEAAKAPAAAEQPAPQPTKEELEKKFHDMLSGVTLKGHFTADRNDTGAPGKEDQYDIESVTKLTGDLWLFKARIKYGDHDMTVPLPLPVVWAGDTPVITLDKMNVPGFGVFTARVMFFDDRYAGMWDGANHGGVMVGKIVKQPAKESK